MKRKKIIKELKKRIAQENQIYLSLMIRVRSREDYDHEMGKIRAYESVLKMLKK